MDETHTIWYRGRKHILATPREPSPKLPNSPYESSHPVPRPSITKMLKIAVWIREFGEASVGKCPICKITELSRLTGFQCGHIIAHAKGGKAVLENLRPICQSCNSGMRTTDMTTFIQSLRDPTCASDRLNNVLRRITWAKKYGWETRGPCKCGIVFMCDAVYEKIRPEEGWYLGNIDICCPQCRGAHDLRNDGDSVIQEDVWRVAREFMSVFKAAGGSITISPTQSSHYENRLRDIIERHENVLIENQSIVSLELADAVIKVSKHCDCTCTKTYKVGVSGKPEMILTW